MTDASATGCPHPAAMIGWLKSLLLNRFFHKSFTH
jgi:hypothetical protein